jgi:hypothetical protein
MNADLASEYRSDLINSKKYLAETEKGRRVLSIIGDLCGNFKTAYALAHTPEQGEDIFRILVDGKSVVGFDLQHDDGTARNVNIMPVTEYRGYLSDRDSKLLLSVALELSKQDMLA